MFNHTKKEGNLERRERERETWVLGCEEEGKKKGLFTFTKKEWGKKSVKPVLCSWCGSN